MKTSHLLALWAGLAVSLTIAVELTDQIANPSPVTSPAVVTEPVVTVPLATLPTLPATTTTIPSEAPKTAHDALQADLSLLIAPDTPCQEWAALVLEVGWPADELVNVLEEMHQESRCLNVIPGDRRFNGNDHGLMQINRIWRDEVEALFGDWQQINDPQVNLAMALEIWSWHQHHHGCGWQPWSRPC